MMIIDNCNNLPAKKATSAIGYAMRLWKQSNCGMLSDWRCMNMNGCNMNHCMGNTCQANPCSGCECGTICKNPPSPVIVMPVEGQTTDAQPMITGTAQRGTMVNICITSRGCTDVAVDSDGQFSLQLPFALNPGIYTITATALIPGTDRRSEPATRTFEVISLASRQVQNQARTEARSVQQTRMVRPTGMAGSFAGMAGMANADTPRNQNDPAALKASMTVQKARVDSNSDMPRLTALQMQQRNQLAKEEQIRIQHPANSQNKAATAMRAAIAKRNEILKQRSTDRIRMSDMQSPNLSANQRPMANVSPIAYQSEATMRHDNVQDPMRNQQTILHAGMESTENTCYGDCQPPVFEIAPLVKLDEMPKPAPRTHAGIENEEVYHQMARENSISMNMPLVNQKNTPYDDEMSYDQAMECDEDCCAKTPGSIFQEKAAMYKPDET